MPKLSNPKQELFAQNVASGMGSLQAYQAAGYSNNAQAASNLLALDKVKSRVDELTERRLAIIEKAEFKAIERAAHKLSLSKEYVLGRLMDVVESSMSSVLTTEGKYNAGAASAANKSLQLLGSHLGLWIDRKEIGSAGEFRALDAKEVKGVIEQRLIELANRAHGADA